MRAERILVVEREGGLALSIQHGLTTSGFGVAALCETPALAVARAAELQPSLVLMDIPPNGEEEAVQAADLIRKTYKIPVLFMTADPGETTILRPKESDPFGYIVKPFEPRELAVTIEASLYRHTVESKLRGAEQLLASTERSSEEAVITTNPAGKIMFMNSMAESLTGWTLPDAVGHPLSKVFVIEDENTGERLCLESPVLAAQPSSASGVSGRGVLLSRTGRRLALQHTSAPIRGDDNSVEGMVVLFRDLSAPRERDNSLKLLEAALQQSDESIVITDADLEAPGPRIVFVSPGFSSLTGYSAEEVVGRSPRLLQGPKTDRALLRMFKKSLSLGLSFRGQITNYRKDGSEYTIEWSVQPIRDRSEKVTHFMALQRDITDRLQLEKQLQAAQKMESIGRLAAGIAHDFNNMLAVIRGNVSLLLLDESQPDRVKSLRDMDSAVERAANLTRQLLAFSRRHAMEPRPLDLNQQLEQIARLLRRVLPSHIAVELQFDPDIPHVDADPGLIDQVVMNLAVNAQDAMPRGGQLRFRTSTFTVTPEFACANPDAAEGRFVCLEIEDSGCGIPERIMPRIFEPFFTTKELGKGTGLGLSTVYGIVKQHRGWIRVQSHAGKGTAFRVCFPVCGQNAPARPGADVETFATGQGEGILVVEHQEQLRTLAASVLRRCGYTVFEALNGTAALEQWERHSRKIALLLTDFILPEGSSGRELANALRKRKGSLKVIIASGYSPEFVDPTFGSDEGAFFLWKPYGLEELARTVRKTLDAPSPACGKRST